MKKECFIVTLLLWLCDDFNDGDLWTIDFMTTKRNPVYYQQDCLS